LLRALVPLANLRALELPELDYCYRQDDTTRMLAMQTLLTAPLSTTFLTDLQTSPRFAETRALLERFDQLVEQSDLQPSEKERVITAKRVSLLVHRGQPDRPDGQPYINHPLQVTLTLANKFGLQDPDLLIAALLHDSVEDRPETLIEALGGSIQADRDIREQAFDQLRIAFGARVSEIVKHLTNPDFDEQASTLIQAGDTRSIKEIKRALYHDHFLEILREDPYAFMVKLSDFEQNAYNLGNLTAEARAPLQAKYGPVITSVRHHLQYLSAESPLFPFRARLQQELHDVYERDYRRPATVQ